VGSSELILRGPTLNIGENNLRTEYTDVKNCFFTTVIALAKVRDSGVSGSITETLYGNDPCDILGE
jgi:hypothetical protein